MKQHQAPHQMTKHQNVRYVLLMVEMLNQKIPVNRIKMYATVNQVLVVVIKMAVLQQLKLMLNLIH